MRHKRLQKSEVFPSIDEAEDLSILSAPVTPSPAMTNYHVLHNVQETHSALTSPGIPDSPKDESFGSAAMEMRRRRRSSAMEIYGALAPSCLSRASTQSGVSSDRIAPLRSPSRLSPVHTTRHPLSLSGLHLALHGALSAKRYACSYLLALRFQDDDDDAYWEDVRSVMALLTSTFVNASTRLMDALDEAAKRRMKDERPSPNIQPTAHLRSVSGSSSTAASMSLKSTGQNFPLPLRKKRQQHMPVRTMAEMMTTVSFAPMPSQLMRFATHVDAIVCALNDAREDLEQCVEALRLRTDAKANIDDTNQVHSREADKNARVVETQEHPAFQAYDRLRKELGLALRECERGREKLLDIIAGPQDVPNDDTDADVDDTPALGQDTGSEESDKVGPLSPSILQAHLDSAMPRGVDAGEVGGLGLNVAGDHGDDATEHLLRGASSRHLPEPGVEQVFEADTHTPEVPFTRERSKLSREERIKLAKARRASVNDARALLSLESAPAAEKWGPEGEVVQELKDVIWKVGERRRKLTEAAAASPVADAKDAERGVANASSEEGIVTFDLHRTVAEHSVELLETSP